VHGLSQHARGLDAAAKRQLTRSVAAAAAAVYQARMRAILLTELIDPKAGFAEQLRVAELPELSAGPGEVLVQVHAAGCNFFDLLICQGKYQVSPALPFTPGGEVAGEVTQVGSGVSEFTVGQRVLGSLPYGGFATHVLAKPAQLSPLPDSVGYRVGAALPVAYPCAYAALVDRVKIRRGETILVTGAAGGVGLACVQLGAALGARVIALAGGSDKLELARAHGAELAVNYREPDWTERVMSVTGGRGVDAVIENVGGEVFEGCMKLLAWDARLVVMGFASGQIPSVKLNRVLLKHIALLGLHWGAMFEHQPARVQELFREVLKLVESKRVRPFVQRTFGLEGVGEALDLIDSRQSLGKLVIEP